MARPKSNVSTASTVEKNTVETADTTKQQVTESKTTETVVKEPKSEKIAADDFVTVQNKKYAYKRVRSLIEVYEFDKEGKAKVSGKDAKAFLKIPGFTLVK